MTHTRIGWREWVRLPDLAPTPIKAKIDTGARTSALHAHRLKVEERGDALVAVFEVHPAQRSRAGAIHAEVPVHTFRTVRSSSGHSERRPVIRTPLEIGDNGFLIEVTLTGRDEMGFRLLLGRSALRRRFLVDSGASFVANLRGQPPEEEVT